MGGGSGPRTLVSRSRTEASSGGAPQHCEKQKTGVGGEGKRGWRGRKSEMERKEEEIGEERWEENKREEGAGGERREQEGREVERSLEDLEGTSQGQAPPSLAAAVMVI